jgi:hypothetical protein
MRPRRPRGETAAAPREWIAPGSSTVFSVLMVWLAPRYEHWFGVALPAFTRQFFALYPLWIVISTAALLVAALGGQIAPIARWRRTWTGADAVLTIVSVLIIAGGVIALFLPLLIRPEPG